MIRNAVDFVLVLFGQTDALTPGRGRDDDQHGKNVAHGGPPILEIDSGCIDYIGFSVG